MRKEIVHHHHTKEMSGTRGNMSLSALLAEVDKLEREIRDLSREEQRGEEYVKQLEQIIDKDIRQGQEIERDIVDLNREIAELEQRERFLISANETASQSVQLLKQMENDAREKLLNEVNITNDLYHKLNSQVIINLLSSSSPFPSFP